MKNNYFLPYQERWLNDKSKIKIWEKSRRIGATYVQSYEDVRDCVNKTVPAVWFSSADESAAKEYIDYCEQWVKLFHITAKRLGEVIIDNDKDIKAFVIQFSNGTKIHALSSNPKGFRSKGGKVVLDEFAFHNNPEELWKAARPCITWGFPLRILSTHNGQNCLYYKFIDQVQKELGCKVVYLDGRKEDAFRPNSKVMKTEGPADFIRLIKNAEIVITTSFHGTAFSLIYNKPLMAVVRNKDKTDSRISSLLKELNCENLLVPFDSERTFTKNKYEIEIGCDTLKTYVSNSESYLKKMFLVPLGQ